MSGLVESATAIMSASERRLEIVSHNVANVATPGYKRQVGFSEIMAARSPADGASIVLSARSDPAQGKLADTGAPLDLAISGVGYFKLRAGTETFYSRAGQFRRAEDGSIVTASGHVLQQAGGGDLVLDSAAVEILNDGTVLDGGRPVARVALFTPGEGARLDPVGGTRFAAVGTMDEAGEVMIRQGMTESSNVSSGDEMVTMMAAMRQAEGGARLIQLYDELMGRALTSLGGAGR